MIKLNKIVVKSNRKRLKYFIYSGVFLVSYEIVSYETKTFREDRTAAERNYIAEATRRLFSRILFSLIKAFFETQNVRVCRFAFPCTGYKKIKFDLLSFISSIQTNSIPLLL